MKKTAMVVFAAAFVFASGAAYAETVKEAAQKTGNFWAKEGERSGLKESTSSWGQFWAKINPTTFFKDQQDAYNARKSGSVAK